MSTSGDAPGRDAGPSAARARGGSRAGGGFPRDVRPSAAGTHGVSGARAGSGARALLLAAAVLTGTAVGGTETLAARTAPLQAVDEAAGQPASAMEAYRALRAGGVHRFTFDYRGGTRVQLPAARAGDGRAGPPPDGDSGRAAGPAASMSLEAHVTGTWRMRVYRWGADGGLLGWAAPTAQVTLRHHAEGLPGRSLPAPQRMEKQLDREVLLRVGPSGRVETMLLPPNLHPFVEAFWKRWADRVVLRLPGQAGRTEWRAEGRERLGRYRDVYRVEEGGEIVRRREAYLSLRTEATSPAAAARKRRARPSPEAVERRLRAESRYQVHPQRGYLATGSGTLALEVLPGGRAGGPEMLVVHTFRFAADGFRQREAGALRAELLERTGAGSLDGLTRVLETTGPAEAAGGAGPAAGPTPGEAGAQALRPWPGLLEDLERSLRVGDGARAAELGRQLRQHLRADPSKVEAVAARLDGEGTPRTQGMLLDALAEAGTAGAQKTLERWIGDGRDPVTRRRALLSLTHLDAPSDELYERVRELSGDGDAPPAVRREALRAFGTLVARRSVRSFGPEGPVDVLERLRDRASSAEAAATRRAAIHALGNTRLPTAVGPLRELATGDGVEPGDLEAAVAALELIPSATSVDALGRVADEHPDSPVVQHRVVSALTAKTRTAGPESRKRARERLGAMLRESGHPAVRLQVLEHFIARMRRGDGGRARTIVRQAAESNSFEEVRERAGQALEGRERTPG